MKRFIILGIVALCAVSCKLYDAEENPLNSYALMEYGDEILNKKAIIPIVSFEYLLEINDYLKLTSEEQKDPMYDHIRYNLFNIDETRFRFSPKDYDMVIDFDTKGRHLDEIGTSWDCIIIEASYYDQISSRFNITHPESAIWSLEENGNSSKTNPLKIKLTDARETTLDKKWYMNIEGRDYVSHDLYSDFRSERQMKVEWTTVKQDGSYAYTYIIMTEGLLSIDIYRQDKLVDWCRITFANSGKRSYNTSR